MTLRLVEGVPSLRTSAAFRVVCRCLALSRRADFRVVHFSVMRNHLHLILEAAGAEALASAMTGLKVRLARRLNALFGRGGPLFDGRYHVESLDSPSRVRAALQYVLCNARKHASERGITLPADWIDPFSSARTFAGWLEFDDTQEPRAVVRQAVSAPSTYLLTIGWRRGGGGLSVNCVPGSRRRAAS